MLGARFSDKHLVILDRTEKDGSTVYHEVTVPVNSTTIKHAEDDDDVLAQEDVIIAFERRFKRENPTLPLPDELIWKDFRHPIEPA